MSFSQFKAASQHDYFFITSSWWKKEIGANAY